jgi:hypothetical protein
MGPTKEIKYKKLVIKFMDFIHGTVYDVQHKFSNAILGEIVPKDVVRFFKVKAFGIKEDHGICKQNDRATGCCEATFDMNKNSISNYIPNSIPTWDRLHNMDNPTKSGKLKYKREGRQVVQKKTNLFLLSTF